MIKFWVNGVPVPQGSTRAYAVRKGGKLTGGVAVTGDNKKTKSWRAGIVYEARGAMGRAAPGMYRPKFPAEPVAVTMVFVVPRPAAHWGTGKNAAVLRPAAPPLPTTKPDLDKLCRAVLDALTEAGMWRDDSQVATMPARKIYADYWGAPGVLIEVAPCDLSLPGLPEEARRALEEASRG